MIDYCVFSDGAYSSARDQGGIGVVFLKNGDKIMEYSRGFKHTTNNRMEISAVLLTLKAFKKPVDSITIYTDSMYVIGCATLGWQRKKNSNLWKMFDEEMLRVRKLCPNIQFKHVKGHTGLHDEHSKWNSYADKLAVHASQELL